MRMAVAAAALCLALGMPMSVYAETANQPAAQSSESSAAVQRSVSDLEAEVIRLKAQGEQYAYLKEEIKNHREFLERERAALNQTLTTLVAIGTGAMTAFGLLMSWLGWKTRKEFTASIEAQAKRELEEVKVKALKNAEVALQGKVGEMQSAVEGLLEREAWYRRSRVLVLGFQEGLPTSDVGRACEILRGKGLHVEVRDRPAVLYSDDLDRLGISVVVLCYDPSQIVEGDQKGFKQDPLLAMTLQVLRDCNRDIPLLVRANGAVGGPDQDLLKQYVWANYANSPAAFLSNLYNLAHIMA